MAWDKTYSHNLLIALDQFAAAVIFNRPDLTISTMCWMVHNGKCAELKLSAWQHAFLMWLGPLLNKVQTNHMELSRQGDYERAQNTVVMLTVKSEAV